MSTVLDLTRNTDPTRNRRWWTKERFYLFEGQPAYRMLRIFALRWTFWWPFFVTFTIRLPRRFWPESPEVRSGKFYAIQFYFGLPWPRWAGKCDPSRTFLLWQGKLGGTKEQTKAGRYYVITWTFAEMLAARLRWVDEIPVWSNTGGS